MFDNLEIDPVVFWPIVAALAGLAIGLPFGKRLLGRRARLVLAQQAAEGQSYLVAMNALIEGNRDKTIETLLGVVRENTKGVEPYLALGRLFRERGDAARSLRLHQHLLVRPGIPDPARRKALFALGKDLRALGDLPRARRAVERAIRVLKKDADVARELAEICEGLRDWPAAVALRKRAGKLADRPSRPVRSHLLAEWGNDRIAAGDARAGRSLLRKAVRYAPAALHPRVLYADALLAAGHLRDAAENYEIALVTVAPLRGLVIAKLEEAYFQLGDFGRLESFLRGAIEKAPTDDVLRFALARFLLRKGAHDEAIATLRALLAEHPDLRETHRDLGAWLLANGDALQIRAGYGELLASLSRTLTGYRCGSCARASSDIEWRCLSCGSWESQKPNAIVGQPAAIARVATAGA
ncbi:MAG: tetratricopeptide repeat protein [Deltaproteobacteria bacterium]|nr:tetratricopeptide repeat protein [Deltaproteobacteria bacterium]